MSIIESSPLLQALNEHALHMPEKIALIHGEQQVTYASLWQQILQVADSLDNQHTTPDISQILISNKDIDFVYKYFAGHLVGIKNVIVDPSTTQDRLEYIKKIITENVCPCSDTADVMFTTGTTGAPKGVCLTHRNIFSSAQNINSFIGNTVDDIEVLALPLSHSFGLGRMRCTLLKGGTLILLGNFANLKLFFEAVERFHVTGFGMVPAVWQYIKRFSGLRISRYANQFRYIEIGSAEMPISDKRELMELFPSTRICMHYGLTEASRSFFMEFHTSAYNLQTIGKTISSDVESIVVGDNDIECSNGEEGELCIKGSHVTPSYYLPSDNASSFWNGFFRTGDWGYRDDDGNFYLTGRKKEMINVGGKKISPALIEAAICSLGFPDAVCVGVPDPKGVLGEVVKAFIVKGESSLSFDDIREKLTSQLEQYELPAIFEWIEKVPRTASGKIQRLLLK